MTDYIEREAAISEVVSIHNDRLGAYHAIKDLPAAEVKTQGRWEREVIFGIRVLRCSACGKPQSYGRTSYCPNCGAEMEEDIYPNSQVYQVRREHEQDQGLYQVSTPCSVRGVDRE